MGISLAFCSVMFSYNAMETVRMPGCLFWFQILFSFVFICFRCSHSVSCLVRPNHPVHLARSGSWLWQSFVFFMISRFCQALTSDPLADLVSRWRGCYLEPSATPFWKADQTKYKLWISDITNTNRNGDIKMDENLRLYHTGSIWSMLYSDTLKWYNWNFMKLQYHFRIDLYNVMIAYIEFIYALYIVKHFVWGCFTLLHLDSVSVTSCRHHRNPFPSDERRTIPTVTSTRVDGKSHRHRYQIYTGPTHTMTSSLNRSIFCRAV